jgi:hypothetical protein
VDIETSNTAQIEALNPADTDPVNVVEAADEGDATNAAKGSRRATRYQTQYNMSWAEGIVWIQKCSNRNSPHFGRNLIGSGRGLVSISGD